MTKSVALSQLRGFCLSTSDLKKIKGGNPGGVPNWGYGNGNGNGNNGNNGNGNGNGGGCPPPG